MNKKGFIVIPVLAWWIIGTVVLVGGTTAVKSGLVTILPAEIECLEGTVKTQFGNNFECLTKQKPTSGNVLPAKIEPSPTPISIPTLKPVKPVYVDPDPIINCESSYPNCKESSIRVRQSQCAKITCCQVGSSWSIYPTTEKCSEDQKNYWSKVYSPSTGNSNLPPSEPLINCVLSYGTFQLRQSTCNDFKKSDGPPPESLVDCQIITTYGDFSGKYTQAECDKLKLQASTPSTANIPDQQTTINQHNSQVTSCRSGVGSLSDYQQRCTAYGGSAAQACRQITGQEWQAAYDACGTTY